MNLKSIKFKNFSIRNKSLNLENLSLSLYKKLINSDNQILLSMKKEYKDSYNKKLILSLKRP